ncbi:hypothetical protein E1A91_1Z018300v1 [Gossypium mustelinum]|uniref:Cyclin C-terminal domain-containing protein n=1 Tax=Gossypium mustelinum TaxID=34275 RepID=A0A5C7J263_GOSMU|nr:hypothetical protein E1A91_1Z018300v1 [Gossypium mustelinum]
MEFDLENPLTNSNHLCPPPSPNSTSLFLLESDHMPSHHYIQSLKAGAFPTSVRRNAIASISLQQPKTWVVRLVACSCVSLAAKMTKTEFSLIDFQGDGGFIFDAQTIERMEYLILGALKWRMRSITPFSFISFFISFFNLKDPPLRQALKARAVELILKAQMDTRLMELRPSIIAASALLSASHQLLPLQFPCFRKAISSCSYVNKENMLQCCNWMQEMGKEGEQSESVDEIMASSSNTPVNVLDQHFSCWESEIAADATKTDIKRPRINDYPDNHSVHFSQLQHC